MGVIFGLLRELPAVGEIKTAAGARFGEIIFDRNDMVGAKTCQANLAWLSLRYRDMYSRRTPYYPYYIVGAQSTDQSSLLLAPAFVKHKTNYGFSLEHPSGHYIDRPYGSDDNQLNTYDIYEVSLRKSKFDRIKEHQRTYRFSDYKPEEIEQIYNPQTDEFAIGADSPGSIRLASKPTRKSEIKSALPIRKYWPVRSITDRVLTDFSVLQSLIDLAVAFDKTPQLDRILAKAQEQV